MFANGIWCLPPLFSILPFVWVNTTVNASQHKLPKFLPTWGNVNTARADTGQTGEWDLNIANLCKSQVVLEAFLWSVATLYENIFRRWVFRLNTFCLFLYAAFSKINYPNGIMRLGWATATAHLIIAFAWEMGQERNKSSIAIVFTQEMQNWYAWLMIVNARQEHISTPLLKK